jgi:hypothetical protein
MARQQRSPRKKKFFVKEDDGIYTVTEEFFDEIESREEAMVIAMRTFGEIHTTLHEEALDDGPLFIGNMKVVTGLERCLNELNRRWPFLLMEMRSTPRRINGQIISTC